MLVFWLMALTASVSASQAGASVQFRGVPLGITMAQFKKLRPNVICEQPASYSDTFRCEEKLQRSADLPFKSGNGSVDYYFNKSNQTLAEITFWADYDDEDWVEASLRRAWGEPDSTKDEDGDPELAWFRSGARIRFNPDCEDGAICTEYRLSR